MPSIIQKQEAKKVAAEVQKAVRIALIEAASTSKSISSRDENRVNAQIIAVRRSS